ncbi:MAG: glycosyltransferase WbsX family protein [Panacagrimonas sp.]
MEPAAPVARTNSNLTQLATGPAYRGAVEKVDMVAIRGWCLCAADPAAAVTLDVECEGIRLGQVRTYALRKELSERLGAPAHAGLIFHWTEASTAAREALIEQLSQGSDPSVPLSLRLPIADSGPALELDTTWAGKNGLPTRADLLKHLKSITARPRQTPIAQRESLLRCLPAPRTPSLSPRVRALAFYLPQFHAIPENDEWWGAGFTEWTNVSTAKPLFEGHDQPRIPADLGYYDLRTPGVIEQQIDLARGHGLAGFCFHHYWFSGRRLLEKPLQRFLEIDHDFGFCLCWANEPWSRRWDGSEKEVLVPQVHSLESDIAFIHDVLPLLKDRRYIRVGGKPILIVYRVGLLSDPARVFERWREICVEHGLPGLHVCMAETFDTADVFEQGCDSAVQFPPHRNVAVPLKPGSELLTGLDPDFDGKIYDYAEIVANEIAAAEPEYPRYRSVMAGWDNTSRRGPHAHIFTRFTPELMELWLEHACARTEKCIAQEDERLLFINAWNEWGEGTYLEPDRRHGRALLQVVRDVLHSTTSTATTVALLRKTLETDIGALAAVNRLAGRIECLERAMHHTLAVTRRSLAKGTYSALGTVEPLGLNPLRSGGVAALDRLGAERHRRHRVLRRGDYFHCSGWGLPQDRTLSATSVCFLKIKPVDESRSCHYGYISLRFERDDTTTEAAVKPPRTVPRKRPWSGFVFTANTAPLSPGHYTLSLLFPAAGSDIGCAIETPLHGVIEIVE